MKTLKIEKVSASNRKAKEQTTQEKATAQKLLSKCNFDNATVVIEYNKKLYACKMPLDLLLKQLSIAPSRVKINCPFGKNQVVDLIATNDLECIGESENLKKYYNNPRYKVKNDGQAVEYYIAQKYHTKFDHYAKMSKGAGEFRNTEVKFFSFDKTTGTPSATCENLKTINK